MGITTQLTGPFCPSMRLIAAFNCIKFSLPVTLISLLF